jgi:hypothetical protein
MQSLLIMVAVVSVVVVFLELVSPSPQGKQTNLGQNPAKPIHLYLNANPSRDRRPRIPSLVG